MNMDTKENRKKWVEALRSGKYQQGQGLLEDMDGRFCCIGVGCHALGVTRTEKGLVFYDGCSGHSPHSFQEMVGLTTFWGTFGNNSLVRLNDDEGKTFAEIADIIEAEPEGLFVD